MQKIGATVAKYISSKERSNTINNCPKGTTRGYDFWNRERQESEPVRYVIYLLSGTAGLIRASFGPYLLGLKGGLDFKRPPRAAAPHAPNLPDKLRRREMSSHRVEHRLN